MKKFAVLTALILAGAASTASAMTFNTVTEQAIHRYAPDADVSQLSDREIAVIMNAINSGDSRAEITATVRSLANTAG